MLKMMTERMYHEYLVVPPCWAISYTWNDGCAKREMFPQIGESPRNWRNHRAIGGRVEKIRGMIAQTELMIKKIREVIPQPGEVVEKNRGMIDQNEEVFEKNRGMIDQPGVMIEKIGEVIPQTKVMTEKKRKMIAQVGKWFRNPGNGCANQGKAPQVGKWPRKLGNDCAYVG